jgi:hypothetical protein
MSKINSILNCNQGGNYINKKLKRYQKFINLILISTKNHIVVDEGISK